MTINNGSEAVQVLVVDDNPHIRKLLAVTLNREFSVMECADAVDAMDIILRHQPQVVLLDIMMPGGVDGIQLLDAIRCSPVTRGVSIGMVTAKGQLNDEREALLKGADAYFVKPFSPQEVHDWVRLRIAMAAIQ
jgi:DNA-binding response OmpR family regulator